MYYDDDLINVSAVKCSHPPILNNATMTGSGHVYKASVRYSCHDGFEMPNLGQNVTINCQDDGTWDKNITECVRK